jgi:acyl-CoA thioesterase-1
MYPAAEAAGPDPPYDGNQMKIIWWIASLACWYGCARVQSHSKPDPPAVKSMALHAAPNLDGRPAIVCFGDSLTAGYGVERGKSYPDVLQQELDHAGYRYHVVNLGVSGETTQDGLARLPYVAKQRPQIVIVEFGANDQLRGQAADRSENNLTQMVQQLFDAGAHVVLASVTLPVISGSEYGRKFDAMYTRLAARYQLPLIPFLLDGVAANPQLMQEDGLHPNTEGTRLVAQTVMSKIEPLLRKD